MKASIKFVLPLLCETSGADNQTALQVATRDQLFGEDGDLNRYVNVYLNDEDVRVLDGLATVVTEADSLVILPAMAGGARTSLQR